jgi:integrative and conjugative element protein (TIGR02256 family)
MLAFPVGISGEVILFSVQVLAHLESHRQLRWWQREAGGLLFARIDEKRIIVEEATGPRHGDWRSRFSFGISRVRAQKEIDTRYPLGLHYIGDWHSHPEPIPTPSGRDERTMASRVLESKHKLTGFVFVLIGQAALPRGLTVVVHDGAHSYALSPINQSETIS